jgi:hypothetical protein
MTNSAGRIWVRAKILGILRRISIRPQPDCRTRILLVLNSAIESAQSSTKERPRWREGADCLASTAFSGQRQLFLPPGILIVAGQQTFSEFSEGFIQNRLGNRHLQVALDSEMPQAQGRASVY